MKFSDYPYERIDFDATKKCVDDLIENFRKAKSAKEQIEIIDEFNALNNHISTMFSLASVRNSINTKDAFYEKEREYMDEILPHFTSIIDRFSKEMMSSKYLEELKKHYGKYLFKKIELQMKTFNPIIMDDMVEENKLSTKYSKLIASCNIDFDGKTCNLSQLAAYFQDNDREKRKAAQTAYWSFFEQHEEEFDDIYDSLVKVRDTIAKKLGYENYVGFAYDYLGRTDYDSKMVEGYRKQILDNVVPLTEKLYLRQEKRIGLDHMYYYDLPIQFLSGNAKPKGTPEELVAYAKEMYTEMSKDTEEFFNFMVEHDLLDLVTKPGKEGGGYCTYFPDFKSPFIFSNFNGTSADVDVLTHEAGHAFQVYQSRDIKVPDYIWPTYEACEIHSMSMEFFAYPWMDKFFREDALKYRFYHLQDALEFIPYGASIDEFQHFVYENPQATKEERKAKYREIEKKYLPHKDYENNELLNKGAYWFRQGHVFSSPFYYIDYTLAQICALQYYIKDLENHEKAWKNYVELCKLGGSKTFLELLESVKLDNPFSFNTVGKVCKKCDEILSNMNEENL